MGCLHMGNLYETIHALCVRKGVTDSRMCTDIGISRGIMSDLKSGRKFGLSTKTLNKIAEYFSVSIDSIVGDEKTATPEGDGLDEDTLKLARRYQSMNAEGRKAMRALAKVLAQDDDNE